MSSVRYLKRWKIRALDKILYCSFFSSTLHLCHSNDPKYDEFINYYRQHIFLSRCFFLSVVFELPSLSSLSKSRGGGAGGKLGAPYSETK